MFMLSRMLVGNTPPIVYMQPTDSETYQVGEALKLASGKVTLCSGAAAPSHVCVGPVDDNGVVPCVEVFRAERDHLRRLPGAAEGISGEPGRGVPA